MSQKPKYRIIFGGKYIYYFKSYLFNGKYLKNEAYGFLYTKKILR